MASRVFLRRCLAQIILTVVRLVTIEMVNMFCG